MPPLETQWQPELVLFCESTSVPGLSGVGRCVLGAHLALQTSGDVPQLEATKAVGLWIAFYGKQVLDWQWEPYDQPSPAAYMPLPLSAFEVVSLPAGALLVQQKATGLRLPHPVINGGGGNHAVQLARSPEDALRVIQQLLRDIGADTEPALDRVELVLAKLLESHASAVTRAAALAEATTAPSP